MMVLNQNCASKPGLTATQPTTTSVLLKLSHKNIAKGWKLLLKTKLPSLILF